MSRRSWPNNGPTRATRTRVSALASAAWGGSATASGRSSRPPPLLQPWRRHRRLAAVGTIALRNTIVARVARLGAGAPLSLGDCARAQVCLTADSEQARVTSCVGTDRTEGRRDLDHRTVARPGAAVISSLPGHALPQLVPSNSDAGVPRRWRLFAAVNSPAAQAPVRGQSMRRSPPRVTVVRVLRSGSA